MRKILVMIPAGEVYDRDCTRWYHWDDRQQTIAHYHNIGDSFVFDSSLKLLDYDHVQAVNIREVNEKLIARATAERDWALDRLLPRQIALLRETAEFRAKLRNSS